MTSDFCIIAEPEATPNVPDVRVEVCGTTPALIFEGTLTTEMQYISVTDMKKFSGGSVSKSGHDVLDILKRDHCFDDPFTLYYQLIDSLIESLTPPDAHIVLVCKHFYTFKFTFKTSSECSNVASFIRVRKEKMSSQVQLMPAFNMNHNPLIPNLDDFSAGWQMFSLLSTLHKMNRRSQNMQFRISEVNKGFGVCQSYPERIIVPVTVTDDDLVQSSKFREGGRFPVVCFIHEAKQTTLVRSSQPLLTSMNRTSPKDYHVLALSAPHNKNINVSYIVDTRSQADASSDKVRGGGYESEDYKPKFHHFQRPLERVSNMLESLVKFMKALKANHSSVESYLLAIESSKWLDHVRSLIIHASLMFQILNQEYTSVLVHGLEGRDTTLCSTSLTQIIADAECRRMRGFQELIHREWVLAGHPFEERLSSLFVQNKAKDSRKVAAPVFLLFLDAVWQFTRCFPTQFEFNEAFLIFLAESAYSRTFGNFLCNNECERISNAVFSKTMSIWQYLSIQSNCSRFYNGLYNPHKVKPLHFPLSPENIVPWTSLYLRRSNRHHKAMMERTCEQQRMNTQLIAQAEMLKKEKLRMQKILHEKMGDC